MALSVQYDIHDLGKTVILYPYPPNIDIDMWTVVGGLKLANNPYPKDVDLEAF